METGGDCIEPELRSGDLYTAEASTCEGGDLEAQPCNSLLEIEIDLGDAVSQAANRASARSLSSPGALQCPKPSRVALQELRQQEIGHAQNELHLHVLPSAVIPQKHSLVKTLGQYEDVENDMDADLFETGLWSP